MSDINPRDLKVDTYTAGYLVDVAVRVTHLPTGAWATARHASKLSARRMAMEKLRALLNAKEEPQ